MLLIPRAASAAACADVGLDGPLRLRRNWERPAVSIGGVVEVVLVLVVLVVDDIVEIGS